MIATDPAWSIHLGTVAQTVIRLSCPPWLPGAPWPLSRTLAELAGLDVRPSGRFRSLGSGRGTPIIHEQAASWRSLALDLEACAGPDGMEVILEMPDGDALSASAVEEDALWQLVDVAAAATDARHGSIGDGEAMVPGMPAGDGGWRTRLERHVGLLVPHAGEIDWEGRACLYRELPRSRLTVVLR